MQPGSRYPKPVATARAWATTPRWACVTSFGRPVVPEDVNATHGDVGSRPVGGRRVAGQLVVGDAALPAADADEGPQRRGVDLVEDRDEVDVLEAGPERERAGLRAHEDVLHLVGAEARVDRDRERAQAGEREVQLEPRGAVGEPQRHPVARADPERLQPAGDGRGALVQRRERERLVLEDQRGRSRRSAGKLSQQARQRLRSLPAKHPSVRGTRQPRQAGPETASGSAEPTVLSSRGPSLRRRLRFP